jgi:hypothetical protein
MVTFTKPSSSSSREQWRYDRLEQEVDDIAEDSHAAGTGVEAVKGEMDQVPRSTAGRKSDDTATYVPVVEFVQP